MDPGLFNGSNPQLAYRACQNLGLTDYSENRDDHAEDGKATQVS
jgi:hypothetical protein